MKRTKKFPALALGLVALLLLTAALFIWGRTRPPTPPPPAPPATVAPVPPPSAPVAIQDGQTIDFSSGQPEVRQTPADQAAMDAALQRMQEAAAEVTFPPSAPPPPR